MSPSPDTTLASSTFATSTTPSAPSGPASNTPTSTSDTQQESHTNSHSNNGLVNYYFVFIALGILVFFSIAWVFLHKRNRARARQLRSQQHALSRDLAGSNVGRGWTYGENRTRLWGDGGGILAMARRARRNADEGLDERGEAPPPYKAEEDGDVVIAQGERRRSGGGQNQNTDAVAIPLRTVAREDVGLKPPDYSEVVAREMDDQTRGASSSSSETEERRSSSRDDTTRNS